MGNSEKADRAKQFAPFDPLKGFREALLEKERITVPKIELSEDRKEELDQKLQQIKRNDIITVVYYNNGEYLQITGMLSNISVSARMLQVVNTRISLDDICAIDFTEN